MANTQRTILRNRLRRHPDQIVIQQDLEAIGVSGISDLKLADLIAICARHGIGKPTANEIAAFEASRASGGTFAAAMAAADALQAAPTARMAPIAEATEALDEAGPEEDEATATPAPELANAATDETAARAKALTQETLQLLGAGKFVEFNAKLQEIATLAVRPDPEPQIIEVGSVSLPEGYTCANRIGVKTMTEAGLPAPLYGNVAKTALAVYDAPHAPRVDGSYIWPDLSAPMLTQLARGRSVFITGPAGTGKTTWAQQVAARWGRPFVRISCDDQTEAATLVGMTVPNKEGGVTWQDGQLTAAIRQPGTVILIDEPSIARPGALFVLQAVLDSDRRIHIAETGEVVCAAPDVLFILADNTNGTGDVTGQYEATRRLNRAFLDRAGVTVRFDYMSAAEEARAIAARTGCDKRVATELTRFAGLTRQKAVSGDISHALGIRRLMSLAELITDGIDPALAFQMAVIETAPFDDQEPLRQMFASDFKADAVRGLA